MATKNVTLRMPVSMVEYLDSENSSIQAAVINSIDALRTIRKYSLNELMGKFKPKEWLFFADILNSIIVDGLFRGSAEALVATCKDAAELNGTYDVDIDALTQKIKTLTGAQVEALYYRVEKYWSLDDFPKDLEGWENF